MNLHKLAFLIMALGLGAVCNMHAQNVPEANFEFEIIPNCDTLIVQFTDLSTNNPTAWEWTFEGGQPNTSNLQNPIVYYNNIGIFDVGLTAYNSAGSGSVLLPNSVTYNPQLFPFIIPNSKFKCEESSTTLNLFDPGGYSFSWAPTTNVSNTNSLNPTFNNNTPTYYTVTITDQSTNCEFVDSILIDIYPSIDLQMGSNIGICPGDTVTLSATTNQTPVSIFWSPNNSLTNSNSLSPSAFPTNNTTYQIAVEDENNCITTGTQQVVIDNTLQVYAGENETICAGESIELTATGGTTYQWTPATGLSNPNIPNPIATPSSSTIYSVSVSDGVCFGLDIVSVNVLPVPTSNYVTNDIICAGDTIQFVNDLANPNWNYVWDNAVNLSNDTIAEPLAFPTSDTNFNLTISNDIGCESMVSIDIETSSNLNISSNVMDTTICQGDTIALSVSGGQMYQWSPNIGLSNNMSNSVNAFPEVSTLYTLYASEGNCTDSILINVNVDIAPNVDAGADIYVCNGDEVQLNAVGADNYQWFPSSGLSNAFIATPFFSGTNSTEYIIEGTNGIGCKNYDTLFVEVKNLPNVTISPNFPSTCVGEEIGMTANGAATYVWSPATFLNSTTNNTALCTPTENITYNVVGTDEFNCQSEVEVNVSVVGFVDLQLNSDTIIGCVNTPVALSAVGADSYFWSPSYGLNSTSGDTVFCTSQNVDTLTYMVQGTDVIGCSQEKAVTVIINENPVVFAGEDDSVCYGDQISLTASGANFYSWTPADSISSPFISNPVIEPSTSLNYIVKGTNTFGCFATDSVFIEVLPLPQTSLNNGEIEKCSDENTILLATGGVAYEWEPAAGLDDPFSDNPTTSTTSSLIYTVNITNEFECSVVDSITIIVKECVDNIRDVVPSAFSPNGDNINENWVLNHPIFLEYPNLEVAIFNRWGHKLFDGNGFNIAWDGRHKGKFLPESTYYYTLKLEAGTELITGSIVIIK